MCVEGGGEKGGQMKRKFEGEEGGGDGQREREEREYPRGERQSVRNMTAPLSDQLSVDVG